MGTIHRVTLSLATKSVILYLPHRLTTTVMRAAEARGVRCATRGYYSYPAGTDPWPNFIEMRLALHEHRAYPLVSHR